MSRAKRRSRGAGVVLGAVLLVATGLPSAQAATGSGAASCVESSAARPTCVTGQLPDGTPYRFVTPRRWNGAVLVDLDFAADSV